MTEITITSFSELHLALEECRERTNWLFRGQSDANWNLTPKCARPPYSARDDNEIFNIWKQKAVDVADCPPSDDWHWLALAQHHGFATRLLDWSSNPLVAAFFACNDNPNTDGALFAYLGGIKIDEHSFKQSTPWDVAEPVIFNPYLKNRRLSNQSGSFTLSSEPKKCFTQQLRETEKLFKLVISKQYKKKLLTELHSYGIHWGALYPDLDGISKLCNWYVEHGETYIKNQPA